jgi:hypothetical protein
MTEDNHYRVNEENLLVFEDRDTPHEKIYILFEVFETEERPPRTLTNRMFHGGDLEGIKEHAVTQAPIFPENRFEIFEAVPADVDHINLVLNSSALNYRQITERLGRPVWTAKNPTLLEGTIINI